MDFDVWQLPIEEDLPFHEATLRVPGMFRNLPQKILWYAILKLFASAKLFVAFVFDS